MTDPNTLPDKIPETWLAQLREVVKQDARKALVWTILGSSVVAAVVTAGANLYLESVKAGNAAEIEKYKACLDSKKEDLKESRVLYSTLSEHFRTFEGDFEDCIATCEAALKHPADRKVMRFAYDSLTDLPKRLVEIQVASRDERISDEVRQSLNGINEEASPKLMEVTNYDQKIPHMSRLPELVKLYKESLKPQITGTKNQIRTAVGSLKIEPCS